jgi:hypothetical protein
MVRAIKQHVTVEKGGVVRVQSPDLPEGAKAEVIVLVERRVKTQPSLSSFFGTGQGCFTSIEEVDTFIRSERDAWER